MEIIEDIFDIRLVSSGQLFVTVYLIFIEVYLTCHCQFEHLGKKSRRTILLIATAVQSGIIGFCQIQFSVNILPPFYCFVIHRHPYRPVTLSDCVLRQYLCLDIQGKCCNDGKYV